MWKEEVVMEKDKLENPENISHIDPLESRARRTPRKRSMTTLKLQWIAERVRKCRSIQEAVANGTYHVDSREVAKAVLGVRPEDLAYDPDQHEG